MDSHASVWPPGPLLFYLYINIILWSLPRELSLSASDSMHTFIADFLFRSTSPLRTAAVFNFFDKFGRRIGLDMNDYKTKIHAMNGTSGVLICTESGAHLSTHTEFHVPHKFYKYLGVFLFTDPDPQLLYELLQAEISSFFNPISRIFLSLH